MYLHPISLDKSIKFLSKIKKHGIWKCKCCSNILLATIHNKRKTYCSKSCMASDYKVILSGDKNPNHKGLIGKHCRNCGNEYKSYNKNRKFCSNYCYVKSKKPVQKKEVVKKEKKLIKEKPIYVKKILKLNCLTCDLLFESHPSSKRIYCCYNCFILDGGSVRAGKEAVRAMAKYGFKKDANHNEIFDVIKMLTAVHDLSSAGCGVPDGLAWVCGGWQLFDVKNPKTGYGKRGLNDRQKKWAKDWRGGPVYLIYTTDEAQRFARGDFDGIKRFPDVVESVDDAINIINSLK